jgi:hypothetical protein
MTKLQSLNGSHQHFSYKPKLAAKSLDFTLSLLKHRVSLKWFVCVWGRKLSRSDFEQTNAAQIVNVSSG